MRAHAAPHHNKMICLNCLSVRRAALASRHVVSQFPSAQPARSLKTTSPTSSSPAAAVVKLVTGTDEAAGQAKNPVSACPAGTVMTGLNYIKGKDDPVALPDNEYPEWLWTCLETARTRDAAAAGPGAAAATGSGDPANEYSKSKKARREAQRLARREEQRILETGDLSALEPKIPLTQQSIDLPLNEAGTLEGAVDAIKKRDELRLAMRRERRAKIKEDNFLRSM